MSGKSHMNKTAGEQKLASDQSGATAVEYGLLMGGISLTVMIGMKGWGVAVIAMYTLIITTLNNAG